MQMAHYKLTIIIIIIVVIIIIIIIIIISAQRDFSKKFYSCSNFTILISKPIETLLSMNEKQNNSNFGQMFAIVFQITGQNVWFLRVSYPYCRRSIVINIFQVLKKKRKNGLLWFNKSNHKIQNDWTCDMAIKASTRYINFRSAVFL